MHRPRLKDRWELWSGAAVSLAGLAVLAFGGEAETGVVLTALGGLGIVRGWRVPQRFWPSKDPEDYR